MARTVLHETFHWNDELCECAYQFGENGYLVMDGSTGRIQCSRLITPPVQGPQSRLRLSFRVVLGHRYDIAFYDPDDRRIIHCRIGPDGTVLFASGQSWITAPGHYLTFAYGIPANDRAIRSDPNTRDSDETTFSFDRFDFAKGSFRFTSDVARTSMSDAFIRSATEISRIELSTPKAELGSVLRLRNYSHELGEEVLEADEFRWHWQPVRAPEEGYAYDHISPTSLFPKDYRWLQTVTQYGWVKVRFPKTYKGQLEYSLKTPDIERESALLLEEWHPTVEQGCRAHTGIVRGAFFCAGPEEGYSDVARTRFFRDRLFYFAQPVPQPNRVYRIKAAWDPTGYRIRIDDEEMSLDANPVFPFEIKNKPYEGIDAFTLHPGMHGTRLSLWQKLRGDTLPDRLPQPHVAYWGDIRITDLSDET